MEPSDPLDLLDHVSRVYRTLRSAGDAMTMLASAADQVREATPFTACFVLRVAEASLTTHGTTPLRHPAGDALRRRALAGPIALAPGSYESEIVRRPVARDDPRTSRLPSVVATALGFEDLSIVPIVPDVRAVALLVATRDDGEITPADGGCWAPTATPSPPRSTSSSCGCGPRSSCPRSGRRRRRSMPSRAR
ncbi:MAG: hypothetical protein AB7G37_11490 [Solirubrobacteraceae bacterium]